MIDNPLAMFNTDNSNILKEHKKTYDNKEKIKLKTQKKQGRPAIEKEILSYKLTINLSCEEIKKIKSKIAKEKPYCSLSMHIREVLKQAREI